jgi:hypothetical protein
VDHVGGALHFEVGGQRVQSVYYGQGDAVRGEQPAQLSFYGPGFAQIDLTPFLRHGKNRLRILVEHLPGRAWAGGRVRLKKNDRPYHDINQPFSQSGKEGRILYDQPTDIDVNTCPTQTAEDTAHS